ncbi:MAG TPA: helix-turn-helix transcriptional regulator [Pirellulales bacterium]|jgi:DNA-binding transcriptional regulator YiaG
MPNLANVLNEQIGRVANRHIRRQGKVVRKLLAQHRRDIASIRRQLAAVLKAVSALQRQQRRGGAGLHAASSKVVDETNGLRFRADGLKTHRAKLGISALDYGKLVGVSGLTIYHWESKKAKPRRAQLAKLVAVRGLGKREAVKRLDEMK